MVGSQLVEVGCSNVVLRDSLVMRIAISDIVLCTGVALVGGQLDKVQCSYAILVHPLPRQSAMLVRDSGSPPALHGTDYRAPTVLQRDSSLLILEAWLQRDSSLQLALGAGWTCK